MEVRNGKVKFTRDERKETAKAMKRRNPHLTKQEIHAGIAGLEASTPSQRLAWALEDREHLGATREAGCKPQPPAIEVRPEPVAERDYIPKEPENRTSGFQYLNGR